MKKKNLIIYIVAGAVALAGLSTIGVFAVKKIKSNHETTAANTEAYYEEFGTDGYTVVEESTEELMTNENGELIELYTDKEGNTYESVIVTDANGEVVTNANGEKVTSTKPNAKAVATTKKGTTSKKPISNSGITDGAKVDNNSTVKINDNGTASIVKSDGTVALSYSYDSVGNYFYTDDNPWQRNFGFNRLYDMGAAFTVMYYDTLRVKYTYGNYDWMVQMWKGQYGLLFIGSEIGLYYRQKGKTTDHYECATEAMELKMQMTLYREGYGELFTRPYANHWWITAFVPGKLKKFSDRSELTMIGKIQFKSEEERKLFCAALEKISDIDGNSFNHVGQISKNSPEHYTYSGSTVDFVWRYFDADRKTSTKPTTTKTPVTAPTEAPTKAPTTVAPTTQAIPTTVPVSHVSESTTVATEQP